MTKTKKAFDLYIDRQPMVIREWEIQRDEVRISLSDGTEVKFRPKGFESKGGEYHLYGLLESLFPNIARDYYLDTWQIAYIEYLAHKRQLASQDTDKYTIEKFDNRFHTKEALAFKAGYKSKGNL